MMQSGDNIGRYQIVELIGGGGMGDVYLAQDTELQRRVAIKLFTRELPEGDEARDHLLHEARAASALSHPNVCTVFEVGDADGRPFIVMEFVEGRTLDALIATRELPTERVVRYGAQIADAIAHAHENGVVHRDLKSANVVITNDGRAKVLDFGLASTAAGDGDAVTRNVTSAEIGKVSGTLSYMAPEVLRGREADPRSDIWALGVVLYEDTTGHLPFRGDTAFEVSTALMKDSAEIPVDTSAGLKTVIQRCLQKSPGERYQSAAEIRAALEMLQSGGSSSNDALADEVAAAARAARAPNRALMAALGAAAIVIAVVGMTMLRSSDDAPDPGTVAAAGPGIGASGRPTIAVLPFRDHTASEETAWMSEGIPSMLLTSLAQAPDLDVVSPTRVQGIVQQLGAAALVSRDADVVAEFARRSGAGAIVVGDLYYTGTDYRVEVQVEDVTSGRLLDAFSATGPFVFELVDDLSAQIRAGLNLGDSPATESIAAVTTGNLDAWRAYNEGMVATQNLRYPDAMASFEEAMALDPNFTMAYFYAARIGLDVSDPGKVEEYDAFVKANLDRLSERDRLFVESAYVFQDDEDFERAAEMLEDLVRRYPDHENGWLGLGMAYGASELQFTDAQIDAWERGVAAIPTFGLLHNQLGYAMLGRGRYTEAVRAIERYVDLNPEEPNAYDSLAEIYTASGQPELGLEKYTEILELDPQWLGTHLGRAMTLAMLGRFDEAFVALDDVEDVTRDSRAAGAYALMGGYMLAKLGRYEEAIDLIRAGQEAAESVGIAILVKSYTMLAVDLALEAGDNETVLGLVDDALDGIDEVELPAARRDIAVGARSMAGIAQARLGRLDEARQILDELEDLPATAGATEAWAGGMLRAEIAYAEEDFGEAERAYAATEPPLKAYYSVGSLPPTLLSNTSSLRAGVARAQVAQGYNAPRG